MSNNIKKEIAQNLFEGLLFIINSSIKLLIANIYIIYNICIWFCCKWNLNKIRFTADSDIMAIPPIKFNIL